MGKRLFRAVPGALLCLSAASPALAAGDGEIPPEAMAKVLYIAAAILIGGGILDYFLKRKRK